MSDKPAPPPHVAVAAAVVDTWLREQNTSPKSAAEIAKMSAADRLDYARKFDQSKMAWKDPRS